MCELFAVSSSTPVEVKYSLHAFAEHGGLIHPNKSGWGIAYHEGRDALLIKEPEPASESPWVRFIETQPLTSTCVMAHVRYATAGVPSFANTHPFMRELGGRMHLFAHNGGFDGIWQKETLRSGVYHPTGETDSEFAFCLLLERLAPVWRGAEGPPPLPDRLAIVAEMARNLARWDRQTSSIPTETFFSPTPTNDTGTKVAGTSATPGRPVSALPATAICW